MEATVAVFAIVLAALAADSAFAERNSREHAQALAREAAAQVDKQKVAGRKRSAPSAEAPKLKSSAATPPCVIRPVMSDGEIQQCRVSYRYETPRK